MDFREKMQCSGLGFREYVGALEVERQKIQMFQRELPLCLDLVTQTIERCKQQLISSSSGATTTTEYLHGHQSECTSEHVTSGGEEHVFEEFIPLKRTCSGSDHNGNDEDEEQESPADKSTVKRNDSKDNMVIDNKKKSDWLRSVQLWNDPTPDPPQKEELPKMGLVTEGKRNGGAFQPFQREKNAGKNSGSPAAAAATAAPAPAASSSGAGGGKKEEQKEGLRKQRRNWSPELHKRFLNALQQLGGSHAATPKQIRELMKVDGLTNDEVKSHLQKFRLHTRRPAQPIPANGNAQTPQVVFVGGIWVQPSDYAAAVASAAASGDPSASAIYAPVAAPPPVIQHAAALQRPPAQSKPARRSHSEEERASPVSEGGVQHSHSPATSSSTHTTTTSHAF